MSVFNKNATNHLEAKVFFDENGGLGIARYDQVKYPALKRIAKSQRGFHWSPEEVDINTDRTDFQGLSENEKHIFTSNLKRQILLDSVQGRAPALMFNTVTALPEMENLATTWTYFEEIHSESYTHIIDNVYPSAGEVFDNLTNIPEIIACSDDIAKYYDDYEFHMHAFKFLGFGDHVVNGKKISITPYEMKKKLWLMLVSINVLEGVRFYVSFACSWAFAETKRMVGNANIIKLICRDENLHLSATQKLIRSILPKDDLDFALIRDETKDECMEIFTTAIQQEKDWARFLFRNGSIIGLNEDLLGQYVDYIGAQRMKAVGLVPNFKAPTSNPLPWTLGWITSKGVQEAPQEIDKTQYIVGGVEQDLNPESFTGFSL
jgi:ribonucleoside-diphosphate reductase beta chain